MGIPTSVTRILVVTDMQNDFITGTLGTAEAQAIVENVCSCIRGFDGGVVYTMDTHSESYPLTQEGRRLPVAHCYSDTMGWALDERVRAALTERGCIDEQHMVIKSAFSTAALPARIRSLFGDTPDEIVLIGLCTDICVLANAILLKTAFPEARIAVDASCCAGVTPESHRTALAAMRGVQIDII